MCHCLLRPGIEPAFLACLTCNVVSHWVLSARRISENRERTWTAVLRNFWSRDPRGPPVALSATWTPCACRRTHRYITWTVRWPDLWAAGHLFVTSLSTGEPTHCIIHRLAEWMTYRLPVTQLLSCGIWRSIVCQLVTDVWEKRPLSFRVEESVHLWPWTWRQRNLPQRSYSATKLHGLTSQKTAIFIRIFRTSNLTSIYTYGKYGLNIIYIYIYIYIYIRYLMI